MIRNLDSGNGPFFEDLVIGQVFDSAPGVTLTSGLAAAHQAILGDRLRLPLDAELSNRVLDGRGSPPAHPGLVSNVAIGQSTLVTRHARANLFYRGLRFRRHPVLGDTLYTTAEVVGLRANTPRPGRAPTGLVAIRIRTVDQRQDVVLDFFRCAMVLQRTSSPLAGQPQGQDIHTLGTGEGTPLQAPAGWNLAAFRQAVPGAHAADYAVGMTFASTADVVSSAPELARLTLNVADTHHDYRVGDAGRLVYGGHTIGLALSQVTRAIPNIVTVLGWESCDHVGPVYGGDTLSSAVSIEHVEPLTGGGSALRLRCQASVVADDVTLSRPVLDWRFTVLLA